MKLAFSSPVPLIGVNPTCSNLNSGYGRIPPLVMLTRQPARNMPSDSRGGRPKHAKTSLNPSKIEATSSSSSTPSVSTGSPVTSRPSSDSTVVRKRQRKLTSFQSQSEYARAIQLSLRRDKRMARQMFQSCTLKYPSEGRFWLAWGQMEARSGKTTVARRVFASGVDENPENVRLLHAWAVFEDRCGRFEDARRLLHRCISLEPGDGISWQKLALLYDKNGDIDMARETFQKGLSADESNPYLWSAWGVVEHRNEQYTKAASLFEKALEIKPRHSRTLQAYAITAEKLEEYDKSEDLFKQALWVAPNSVPTFQAYGMFEARRENLGKARDLFRCGLKLDPKHAPIWHAWAVMEQHVGNYDAARNLFQSGAKAVPENTPILRAWARMELDLGHIDRGVDWRVPRTGYKSNRRNDKGRRNRERGPLRGKKRDDDTTLRSFDENAEMDESKQVSTVAENLMMLRLMIERKSDEDVQNVMKWLDSRAKADRDLYGALAKRQSNDVRLVREWVARRSASDIKAFKKWLDTRYETDRRIGVYVFNWDLPPLASPERVTPMESSDEAMDVADKPVEWLHLDQMPENSLQSFDDDVYFDERTPDYAEGLYFLSRVTSGLADRAALAFCLAAMSFLLIGASSALHHLGYSPAGEQTQVDSSVEREIPPPSGVDAYLYEEGGAESVVKRISAQTFGRAAHKESVENRRQ